MKPVAGKNYSTNFLGIAGINQSKSFKQKKKKAARLTKEEFYNIER